MPEGPEVRRHADALHSVLADHHVVSFEARTREAKAWLNENEQYIVGRRVLRVRSHGKHLIGYIQGRFYFHSHLMMWGRWEAFGPDEERDAVTNRLEKRSLADLPEQRDRRERARIVVDGGAAILYSAPIFNIGKGDPYEQIENLRTLGPDILPYSGKLNQREFFRRLLLPEHMEVTIGAALLNQQIVAGLGNYLRAEVLFHCRLNPWRKVRELTKTQLACLGRAIPELSRRAYLARATADEQDRERMRKDSSLVYQAGREMGTRHLVFRRTNLPCLRCGTPIKQLRLATYSSSTAGSEEHEERTRIMYFCPHCQRD